jgi:hypothetical protein
MRLWRHRTFKAGPETFAALFLLESSIRPTKETFAAIVSGTDLYPLGSSLAVTNPAETVEHGLNDHPLRPLFAGEGGLFELASLEERFRGQSGLALFLRTVWRG